MLRNTTTPTNTTTTTILFYVNKILAPPAPAPADSFSYFLLPSKNAYRI